MCFRLSRLHFSVISRIFLFSVISSVMKWNREISAYLQYVVYISRHSLCKVQINNKKTRLVRTPFTTLFFILIPQDFGVLLALALWLAFQVIILLYPDALLYQNLFSHYFSLSPKWFKNHLGSPIMSFKSNNRWQIKQNTHTKKVKQYFLLDRKLLRCFTAFRGTVCAKFK